MAIFQPVELSWDGEVFTIPANRVLGAIAVIEEQITFSELVASSSAGRPPMATIAKAFAGVLRYAGSRVTDEEVYAGMFDQGAQESIALSINTLLVMMVPPGALEKHGIAKGAAGGVGEAPASGNREAAAKRSSKRSSRRP
jgi:hypothetical protein